MTARCESPPHHARHHPLDTTPRARQRFRALFAAARPAHSSSVPCCRVTNASANTRPTTRRLAMFSTDPARFPTQSLSPASPATSDKFCTRHQISSAPGNNQIPPPGPMPSLAHAHLDVPKSSISSLHPQPPPSCAVKHRSSFTPSRI